MFVPYTCPGDTRQSTIPLVNAVQGNPLRSRERRFESCRGTVQRHKFERLGNLDAMRRRGYDLRKRGSVPDLIPGPPPEAGPQPRKAQLTGKM
jgi:hypothetical protein